MLVSVSYFTFSWRLSLKYEHLTVTLCTCIYILGYTYSVKSVSSNSVDIILPYDIPSCFVYM